MEMTAPATKECQGKAAEFTANRIPCLDGLRAISILLVLHEHLYMRGLRSSFTIPILDAIPFNGTTGVCFFFVISGFLITSLLLEEKSVRGSISLRNFYIRRCLRIFPPFYVYLFLVAILGATGILTVAPSAFMASALYVYNFYPGPPCQIVDHTWSLSIEEQFYLLWPAMLALGGNRRSVYLAVVGIISWPAVRFMRHGYWFPEVPRSALNIAAMDTILFGVLLAFLYRSASARRAARPLIKSTLCFVAALLALFSLYKYYLFVPTSLTFVLPWSRNLLLTFLVWWCVENPHHAVGKLLRCRPLAHLGVMSYSLYLWQQPFYGRNSWECHSIFGLIFAFGMAHLSYYLIEKPAARLRGRFR